MTNYFDGEAIQFRLGGIPRKMSLSTFDTAMRIYTPAQIASAYFTDYIGVCERTPYEGFKAEEAWVDLGRGAFVAGKTKAIDIRDPHCRLIHRMIAHSINDRGDGQDRVNTRDVWLLHQAFDLNKYTDIPYCLLVFLESAGGFKSNSPMVGGHYVTKLAKHFGILTERVISSLSPVPAMGTIDLSALRRMQVAHYRDHTKKATVWGDPRVFGDDDEEEEEQQDQPEIPHTGRVRPPPGWSSYSAIEGLTDQVGRLSTTVESMQELQRRTAYDQYRMMHETSWTRQAVSNFFDFQDPRPQYPPYQPLPPWEDQAPNPPYDTPYDPWIRRPDGN